MHLENVFQFKKLFYYDGRKRPKWCKVYEHSCLGIVCHIYSLMVITQNYLSAEWTNQVFWEHAIRELIHQAVKKTNIRLFLWTFKYEKQKLGMHDQYHGYKVDIRSFILLVGTGYLIVHLIYLIFSIYTFSKTQLV